MRALDEVENVPLRSTSEALETTASVEDRERWRSVLMERAASFPLAAGALQLNQAACYCRDRVVLPDGCQIKEPAHDCTRSKLGRPAARSSFSNHQFIFGVKVR